MAGIEPRLELYEEDRESKGLSEEERATRRRRIIGVVILLVGLAIAGWHVYSGTRPLDRLQFYEVSVKPQEDGTLVITYYYEWEVLNDSREGPLSWVDLGMANNHFTLLETGGAISRERNTSNYYIAFELDRSYYKGEVATFWFTVQQSRMLCRDSESGALFYDFTPGWFDGMKVQRYRFRWDTSLETLSHNADSADGGWLLWEGRFGKGKSRNMEVYYDAAVFEEEVRLTNWTPSKGGSGATTYVNTEFLVFIALITCVAAYKVVYPGDGYRSGRGYHDSNTHGGGGGGGGGCACAGCACACACASGGRAGCATKDFVGNPYAPVCRRLRGEARAAPGEETAPEAPGGAGPEETGA